MGFEMIHIFLCYTIKLKQMRNFYQFKKTVTEIPTKKFAINNINEIICLTCGLSHIMHRSKETISFCVETTFRKSLVQ